MPFKSRWNPVFRTGRMECSDIHNKYLISYSFRPQKALNYSYFWAIIHHHFLSVHHFYAIFHAPNWIIFLVSDEESEFSNPIVSSNSFISSTFFCSKTLVYKSIVIFKLACPRYVCTVLGGIPASKQRVANVCLNACPENFYIESSGSRIRFISSTIFLIASI